MNEKYAKELEKAEKKYKRDSIIGKVLMIASGAIFLASEVCSGIYEIKAENKYSNYEHLKNNLVMSKKTMQKSADYYIFNVPREKTIDGMFYEFTNDNKQKINKVINELDAKIRDIKKTAEFKKAIKKYIYYDNLTNFSILVFLLSIVASIGIGVKDLSDIDKIHRKMYPLR